MPTTCRSRNTHTGQRFQCRLQCNQCTARTAAGVRCRRRVCIGTTTCFQHRRRDLGVRVAPSPGRGKGLFSTRRLPRDTNILRYDGELLTPAQVSARYGNNAQNGHAPYALSVTQRGANVGRVQDLGCRRGIGGLINGSATRGQANVTASANANRDGSINIRTLDRAIPPNTELLMWYGPLYNQSAQFNEHSTRSR